MTVVRCQLLAAPVASPLRAMTFPAFRHLLDLRPAPLHLNQPSSPTVVPFAVGAFAGDEPVGLALAAGRPGDKPEAELLSVLVASAHRRRGVGQALLAVVEREAAGRGAGRLGAVWMTGSSGAVALEGLLASSGWAQPAPRMLSVRFTLDDVDRAPWLGRYRLGPDFELFPWVKLTVTERERLLTTQRESPWIPRDLQPWDYDRPGFEEVTSLGMRYRGEVVGWTLNHPISATTLRVTCSFIRGDLGRRAKIVPLWAESFRRLAQTPYCRCSFTTPLYHRSMIAFVRRWCGPWVSFLGETRGSAKLLRAAVSFALPHPGPPSTRAVGPARGVVGDGTLGARVSHHSAER